jgi:hypothetical protein
LAFKWLLSPGAVEPFHEKMKVVVALGLIALCSASLSSAEMDAEAFFEGFVSGMRYDQKTPSACYNDTVALEKDVRDIVWDL